MGGRRLYAIAQNNFLFDPSEIPHLSADALSHLIGVPRSTMAAKAKRIRDGIGLDAPMDPASCRDELLADHPPAWLVEIDWLIVDVRLLSSELQAEAHRRGLIPDLALHQAALPAGLPPSAQPIAGVKPELGTLQSTNRSGWTAPRSVDTFCVDGVRVGQRSDG